MASRHILHDGVVGLIEDVGPIAVGTAGFEVRVLVHVRVFGDDSIIRIGGIESLQQLVEVTGFLRGIVFEDAQGDIAFEFAREFFLPLVRVIANHG